MKLRSQLVIAGALMVLLPLSTWRYMGEMHSVLRDAGQRELQTWSAAVEAVMNNSRDLGQAVSSETDLYAEYSKHDITLDGYQHDWSDLLQPASLYHYSDNKAVVTEIGRDVANVSLKSAVSATSLFLFFDVQDKTLLFYDPGIGKSQNGDRLLIYIQRMGELKRYLIRAIAPGHLKAFQLLGGVGEQELLLPEPSIKAYWEVKPGGYSIEVKVPEPREIAHFGFSLIDSVGNFEQNLDAWVGTVDPTNEAVKGRLKLPSEVVESHIAHLTPEATRIRLFDESGWLLADVNRLKELAESTHSIDPQKSGLLDALLYRFFSWSMSDELTSVNTHFQLKGPAFLADSGLGEGESWSARYRSSDQALMGEMRALDGKSFDGYLLMERTDESIAVVVNSTLVRLFGILLLLFTALFLGLYFYANWISTRISRLNRATAEALQQDGQIKTDMPGIHAHDEIGELSMGISDLLSRLSSYTEYLRMLASRLAHELRTPLAVVATSLESIDRKRVSDSDLVFIKRAEDAAGRLQGIIRSMTEATRLEQAVQHAELDAFDLLGWLEAVVPLYQSLYPEINFSLRCQQRMPAAVIFASDDLMQQMLDKIISNAADFSPAGGQIEVHLKRDDNHYLLDIVNEGSQLPEGPSQQLFEPMVSHRGREANEPHLGLGLYIVRLIVERHQGVVTVNNRLGGKVRVRISLPAKE